MISKLTPRSNKRWGTTRWVLPKQREMWLSHQKNQKKRTKPELDPQQWKEFEWLLEEAMQENHFLTFHYWEKGYFYKVTGHCHYVNFDQKQFHVKNEENIYFIPFDQIMDIRVMEK